MFQLFQTIFYDPLYNALIFIINNIPGGDIGFAAIILTCLVKLVLFPLSKRATKTQIKMKLVEPELAKLKEKYGSNREEFAKKTMEFYKQNNLNPFASFFLILIQLPIIIALANIFYWGGLPVVDAKLLYSFVSTPVAVNAMFLGLIDVTQRSVVLSVLAGLAQFVQIQLSVPANAPIVASNASKKSFGEDLTRSMNTQMRYVMPVFMFFISLYVSGAVALYWITGSLFMIGQELYFRKTIKKPAA